MAKVYIYTIGEIAQILGARENLGICHIKWSLCLNASPPTLTIIPCTDAACQWCKDNGFKPLDERM